MSVPTPRQLVVIGTGGVGRTAVEIAEAMNRQAPTWELLGFLDDNQQLHGTAVAGVPVVGGLDWLAGCPEVAVAIAVGHPPTRRRIHARLARHGSPLATLIHPRAWVAPRVELGPGAIVYPLASIDVDVQIGALALLNQSCTVGHDCRFGDYVTLAPGVNLGGSVQVGDGCDLGIGCATVQGITIGEWTIVGAGAAVVRSLPANVTAVGVPARVIKERPPGLHS